MGDEAPDDGVGRLVATGDGGLVGAGRGYGATGCDVDHAVPLQLARPTLGRSSSRYQAPGSGHLPPVHGPATGGSAVGPQSAGRTWRTASTDALAAAIELRPIRAR